MTGGTWSSQNKVRPGAYINFEAEPQSTIEISERGIVALMLPLNWGKQGEITELSVTELVTGNSLAKVGLTYNDSEALPLKLAFQNCQTIKLFNLYNGGEKATVTLAAGEEETGVTVTAKHPGTFGNKIAVLVKADNGVYTVETYADGYFVDRQKVTSAANLVENDYVTFSTTGTLAVTSSTLLTGGTNGTVATGALNTFFNLLKSTKWNTLALTSTETADVTSTINFIKTMRENEGKYVQGVVANASATSADYDGIINVVNGVVLEDETQVPANQFTTWVAGATAGASITTSLTGTVVEGATSIIGMLDNDGIISALAEGKFLLSLNQNGSIKVEKDINSLHTFTADKGYTFSKNRIIRELDEMGSSIEDIWETTYLGKVSNNEAGRTLFKSSIIDYLTELQNAGAIDEFDTTQVIVEKGNDVDSVLASIAVKPIDSMEFLYMTINID